MVNTVTNWAGEPSFVSCIYKDHEMPKKHFIDDMKKVFEAFPETEITSVNKIEN